MTKEQNIRRYRYHTTSAVSQPIVRRRASLQREEIREQRTYVAPSGRRVTTPHRAVQPLSAAERRARFRDPQARRITKGRLVPRTFAQTGRPAPVGQMRTNRPLPTRRGAAVPVRRRRGSARFWRRLFGFLAILIVVVIGMSFALNSATFQVQQVQVNGTQNAGLIAAVQHIGLRGQNIFLLNQAMFVTRLEALPLVASAGLDVQLPNHVTVNIQERVPVLLWQSGKTAFGLAKDGVVFASASELSGSSHLVTVLDKRQGVRIHTGSRLNPAQVTFALQLVQQLPGIVGVAPFSLQYVDHISVDGKSEPANQAGAGCYIVISAQGWQVYMGDAVNGTSLADRLLELRQILSMAQQAHLKLATIDLRFGLRPTYTVQS